MEHILGCHGEWLYAAQAMATLPFVGVFVRAYFPSLRALVRVRVYQEHSHD